MTFRYVDNWHTKPINEKLNRKIEQAEAEGFSGIPRQKKKKGSKQSRKKIDFTFRPETILPKKKKKKIKVKVRTAKQNIISAQMHGFSNDVQDVIQDYGNPFDTDENFSGWKIKIKKPKFKAPKIIKQIVKPIAKVVAPITRPIAKIVKPITKPIGRFTTGLAKKPLSIISTPIKTAASVTGMVTRPVLGIVKSVPVVGKLVDPIVSTAVGVVGMVPLVGAPIAKLTSEVATSTGVLKPMSVPTSYSSPSEVSDIQPETTPEPMLPSPTYVSPAPMVTMPQSGSYSSFSERSSSSMPSESSSGGGGGGGGSSDSGSSKMSSSAQESEDKEDEIIKAPIAPEPKKSNAPKVIGALAGIGALYLFMKD